MGRAKLRGHALFAFVRQCFFNLCVLVRAATEGLEQVSASRMAAARTLGATPWRAFWRVEWPALLPWLMSALCLVFLYCFSGFGLALVLGGQHYATVEVEIYTLVAHELQLAQAGVLALWVLLFTGGLAWIYAWVESRLAGPVRADRIARRRPQTASQWLALAAALVVLVIFCLAPLVAIVMRAAQTGAAGWGVLLNPETLDAVWNTVRFSASALVLATLLGLIHALAAQRVIWLRTLVFYRSWCLLSWWHWFVAAVSALDGQRTFVGCRVCFASLSFCC